MQRIEIIVNIGAGSVSFLARLHCYASTVMLLVLVQALKSHCCSQLLHGAALGTKQSCSWICSQFQTPLNSVWLHVSKGIL